MCAVPDIGEPEKHRDRCGSAGRLHVHYHGEPANDVAHSPVPLRRLRRAVLIVLAFGALVALAWGALWLARGVRVRRVIRVTPFMRVEKATGAQDTRLA